MQQELVAYIQAAMHAIGTDNQAVLARRLGLLDRGTVNNWVRKDVLPEPETMVELAEISGADPDRALLELAAWRAERRGQRKAAAGYRRMVRQIFGAAAMLLVVAATGGTQPAHSAPAESDAVYYGKFLRARRNARAPNKFLSLTRGYHRNTLRGRHAAAKLCAPTRRQNPVIHLPPSGSHSGSPAARHGTNPRPARRAVRRSAG